ncbi:hypothetical protein L0F63_001581 [Massospora cicadina]|nr:hypothetical protein L0F63_001581 [Massospora cicadina]
MMEGTTVQQLRANFETYIKEANRLREKYASQIEIIVGAETENVHPGYLGELERLLQGTPVDFLVGSVHHVNGIPIDFDKPTFLQALATCETYEGLFNAYFDAQYAMLQRLTPAIVGHFDLIRLFAPPDPYHHRVKRNVDYVIAYGGLFELNARGWKKGLPSAYPLKDVAEYIVRMGGRFTLGDDAHAPHEVASNYSLLPAYLTTLGIDELWYIHSGSPTKLDAGTEALIRPGALSNGVHLGRITDWRNHGFWKRLE